jgi:hypothetical protein
MLEGLRRKSPPKLDVRTPISFHLLNRLIHSLSRVCKSQYEVRLFSSPFSITYIAMLWVSELAVKSSSDESGYALNYENVKLTKINGENELHIKICSSKTDQWQNSVTLVLQKQSVSDICPIQLLQSYINMRFPGTNGSKKLYVHFNGMPLAKYQLCSILQKYLAFCDVPFHIRSYSFRIGRATDMAKNGVNENMIKQYGRWTSCSFCVISILRFIFTTFSLCLYKFSLNTHSFGGIKIKRVTILSCIVPRFILFFTLLRYRRKWCLDHLMSTMSGRFWTGTSLSLTAYIHVNC